MHVSRFFLLSTWLLLFSVQLAMVPSAVSATDIKGDVVAAEKAWQLIEAGALILDVRSAEEYAEGHLEHSVNIPHTEIDQIIREIGENHDRSVVLYCRSGRRADGTLEALGKLGYTAIFNGTGLEAMEATRPPQE